VTLSTPPGRGAAAVRARSDGYLNLVLKGTYELVEWLGSGAYGLVYRARHQRLNTECAVKILKPEITNDETRKRFLREARTAARLRHKNIVYVSDYDNDEAAGLAYLVMELLRGEPLDKMLGRRIEPDRAIALMLEVCDGVNHAHKNGVFHRDLKPANVVILEATEHEKETIKIVDFGLAKLHHRTDSSVGLASTIQGTPLGTPAYMSPEACRGEALDHRSDIYSLGATLYHMLAGRPPFTAPSFAEITAQHLNDKPPQLTHVPGITTALEAAIMRSLEKDPLRRQQDVLTFAKDLRSALQGSPVSAPSFTLVEFSFPVAQVDCHGKVVSSTTQSARLHRERVGYEVFEMVQIPSGKFLMGSPETEYGRRPDEDPQHEVAVPSFFMSKFEVTQAQWRTVASLAQVKTRLEPWPSARRGDKRPVECITWYEAIEFCERLSRETGREYRLPSEAEWEYACRGGLPTAFCYGENISSDLVNHDGTEPYLNGPQGIRAETTIPVGSSLYANGFGLYEVLGNVWEWCQDAYFRTYHGAPTDGSARFGNEHLPRVIRGGSWRSPPQHCASASRNSFDPHKSDDDIGFRIVHSENSQRAPVPAPLITEQSTEPQPQQNPEPKPTFKEALQTTLKVNSLINVLGNFGRRVLKPKQIETEAPAKSPRFVRVAMLFLLIDLALTILTIDLFVPAVFHNPLEPALWGLVLGSLQAFALRGYLSGVPWWILVTVMGSVAAGLLYEFLGLPWQLTWEYVWGHSSYTMVNNTVSVIVLVMLRWLVVGFTQWLVLRKLASLAWLWGLTTLVASSVCGFLTVVFSHEMTKDNFFTMYVVCTGLLLAVGQSVFFIFWQKKLRSMPPSNGK
jgi:formylglycine-generating enzyme required for sulfatase activity